jgi:hypothetical protein
VRRFIGIDENPEEIYKGLKISFVKLRFVKMKLHQSEYRPKNQPESRYQKLNVDSLYRRIAARRFNFSIDKLGLCFVLILSIHTTLLLIILKRYQLGNVILITSET